MATIKELKLKLASSPYSLGMTPLGCHLLSDLKKCLRGKRVSSKIEIVEAINGYLFKLGGDYFSCGLNESQSGWEKVTSLLEPYSLNLINFYL